MKSLTLLSAELRWRFAVIVALLVIAAVVVGVVQLFRIDIQNQSRLVSFACRARVGQGAESMIAGFAIQEHSQTIVVRAAGPSLASYGVAGAVAGTTLRVIRQSDGQEIARNDDWRVSGNERLQADLSEYAPKDPREAACVLRLRPGAYTVIVEGKAGAQGIALVEIFKVQN
jgi:flagellar biosynthesis/type III secretory pathway M-ring protein FliF/YscJ